MFYPVIPCWFKNKILCAYPLMLYSLLLCLHKMQDESLDCNANYLTDFCWYRQSNIKRCLKHLKGRFMTTCVNKGTANSTYC